MKVNLINENFQEDYVNNLLRARGVEDLDAYLHPNAEYLQTPAAFKNI